MNNQVTILASGGIDSTACINFFVNLKYEIELIFIDYFQAARKNELIAIKKISEYYNLKLTIVKVDFNKQFIEGEVLGRNAFLIFAALMFNSKESTTIAIGIHKGTPYYDCSSKFIKDVEKLVDSYSNESIKISTPFINFNKLEIVKYCISEKVPLELCYSCEKGTDEPCGKCSTCNDLKIIYASKIK